MDSILISVVIPICNDETTVEKCCNSICAQTYKNLEIIFVDDYSEDRSVSIITNKMEKDKRIQLICLDSNQSAFVARKRGVERAKGDYILFCDADDYISEGLCEEILGIQKRVNVDILHFSTEIIDCGVGNAEIVRAKNFFAAYEGKLDKEDVFQKCFVDQLYQYNLWNKLYKRELCKTVFDTFEEWYIPKANDLFAFFFLALKADSYYGAITDEKYFYSYGKGDTGKQKVDLKDFSLYISYTQTVSTMKRLCEKEVDAYSNSMVESALVNVNKKLLHDSLSVWSEKLPAELKSRGFDMIADTWDIEMIADSLVFPFATAFRRNAKYILGAATPETTTKKTKRIAFYYYRMGGGGVERVISLLIPLYLEMGYKVILITEERNDNNDYCIPSQVTWYEVPKLNMVINGNESYGRRACVWKTILDTENIDTVCYHAATSESLFYDLLVSKRLGIKFILSKHELFSQGMVKNLDMIQRYLDIYCLADKLIVLSDTEKLFWNTLSVDAVYIENPFNHNIRVESREDKKYIVWVGRLDPYQKRYQDIVPIMKKVVEAVPDARLKIYGNSETYKDLYRLKYAIVRSGMDHVIEYCGYTKDVNEIYQDARVHLVTSAYESFPMNVYESRIFGVPLVIYDMPYLEMLKEEQGYIAVEQGDIDRAAEAVIALLNDDVFHAKVANGALESGKRYNNDLIKEKWRAVFEDMTQELQDGKLGSREEYAVILKTIAYHSALGCDNARMCNKELWELRRNKMIYEIKLKILQENLEVALYPYGNIGKKTKEILEKYDITVKLAVDQNSKDSEIPIVRTEELRDMDCSQYLFVICSDRGDIYDELRTNIRKYVCENNIYDLYSDYFD